ncbi:MAG: methyl-accepting chemotaxis protein [Clostridium sp.]|nr:methyl-accepting chemotaxis protein [Clostridium sp.]
MENHSTIEKYLHKNFIRIGFVAGIMLGVLGIFAIYEEIMLSKYKAGEGKAVVFTIILVAVIIVAGIVGIDLFLAKLAKQTIARISQPIDIMDNVMSEMSAGNLDTQIHYDYADEFANMMVNADKATDELRKYINNISYTLAQIGNKNMDIAISEDYIGEFVAIQNSMIGIVDSLNDTLKEMRASFGQVRDGAGSLADAAQGMTEGAELQERHVRYLVENIENVSESVHNNSIAAGDVEKLSKDSNERMEQGERKMEELANAMDVIRTESGEIGNIITVITEIADQTNLLALNASIEAARAGENGKGFAVVASEIGTLAASSAEASQNIADLIRKSMDAVDNGVLITGEAKEVLGGISTINSEISKHISKIAEDSRKQDDYLKDMLDSANEIASVVDENTAAAEESSALAEELLGYTDSVMDIIGQYKLRE